MGKHEAIKPAMRPADLRRAVAEWIALGCAVKITPDGTIDVRPPERQRGEDVDLIDWSRR